MSNYCIPDQFNIYIESPDVKDYSLGYDMAFGGKIAELHVNCGMGDGTCSVKINGVSISGLDTLPMNAGRYRYQADGANIFHVGDDIHFSIDSGSGNLLDVRATIVFVK